MRELLAVEFVLPVLIALLLLTMRDSLLLGVISLITSLTSLTASLILLFEVIHVGPVNVELVSEWLRLPYIKPIDISFTLDPLNGLVSSLVCGLTALILTYSISYMRMDGKYSDTRRYWILMLVFMASMLVVINSDNFILMFVGWEGMSLCSYLLIGYYYGDEREYWIGGPPNKAPLYRPSYSSFITFLIVGCADALMLLGILMLVTLVGSPYYEDLAIMLAGRGIPEWLVIFS
ncbi:hypothetical protein KEJ32_06975, partial [Candidatus Bathyarchaeota archaeon]|nr:hypothetical protein [Candidatus Bathyarchaeota archaeon]